MNTIHPKDILKEQGYAVLNELYSTTEVQKLSACINEASEDNQAFLRTKDVFAIRQLLKHIPELKKLVFNEKLSSLLSSIYGATYFLTKAIYFDKPPTSNWFVPYHQDISISVNEKRELTGYKNWTFKKGQYGVEPPLHILENCTTIRIHLDDTSLQNGALRVIPKSHTKGILRTDQKNWDTTTEHICDVKEGGAMLMKPLTLHASNRTTNGKQRRVIHLEFCNQMLDKPLKWLEYCDI